MCLFTPRCASGCCQSRLHVSDDNTVTKRYRCFTSVPRARSHTALEFLDRRRKAGLQCNCIIIAEAFSHCNYPHSTQSRLDLVAHERETRCRPAIEKVLAIADISIPGPKVGERASRCKYMPSSQPETMRWPWQDAPTDIAQTQVG